ncbi:Vegetative incompatibility protein HET-E-1 [Leucoagaricus sp. SymC.cos]|nr:Vegetative incompatibility protein HET-E-1 [Leucoagaricus sp. SymC.cos]
MSTASTGNGQDDVVETTGIRTDMLAKSVVSMSSSTQKGSVIGMKRVDENEDGAGIANQVAPGKAIQISGFTVILDKPVNHALYFKFGVDKTDYPKVSCNQTLKSYVVGEPLTWSLTPYLNLQENSTLTLTLLKKRRLKKDTALVQIVIPYTKLRTHLESVAQDHFRSYEVHTKPKISIDIAAGPYALQTGLNGAVEKSKEHKSVLDHLGRAKFFMGMLVGFAVGVSELDPIAKAVLGCVSAVYDCDQLVLDLAESMAKTLRYIEDVQQFARLPQLKKTIEEIYPLMEDTQNFILMFTNRSGMANFLKAHSVSEKVGDLNKRYGVFQQQFDRGIAIDAALKTDMLVDLLNASKDDALLTQLRPRGTDLNPLTKECMEGTRETILSDVDDWISDFNKSNILWIRGFPGVGKSTLASSIVSRLRAQHRLGSYFVFDRAKVALATSNALWRCAAYDVARQYPASRKCIVERLQDEEVEVNSSNIQTLYRYLIEEPLGASKDDIPKGRLPVFVIDGLDECGGLQGRHSEDREDLLETLKRWQKNLPETFKLIVTSRYEDDIATTLTPISNPLDVSSGTTVTSQASHDIRAYLVHRFRKIAESYQGSLPHDWPGMDVIDELTRRAAGLFIWVATVTEFISSGEPQTQLEEILGHGLEMGDMGVLYSCILQMSFRMPSPRVLDSFNSIVGAMVLAKRPLRRAECIELLKVQPSMLDYIRKGLKSVMDPGNTLRFTHQSFVDFLLYSDKCPSEFVIDTALLYRSLAEGCLNTMSTKLCFNICDLETSTLRNADVEDIEEKIKNGIPSHLSYSCRYWADHLMDVEFNVNLMVSVKQVVYDQLLYWFEVMSLLNELNLVTPILTMVSEWSEKEKDETFDEFIDDALRFIAAFGYAIAQSTPHIYISALPFAPQHSKVAQRFLPKFPRTVRATTGKPIHWPSILFVSEEHYDAVNSVAFSPDQDYFVSGSSDKTICICDAETGNLISGPFEGHESSIASVAFSPDGERVVSGSDDSTVRIWDAESGDQLHCLRGHGNVVTCVVSSNDGKTIASASYDGTIRLWDAESGNPVGEPFVGHESGVLTIAFSRDDRFIVSGSVDRTVMVWDVTSGRCVMSPLSGHDSRVNSVGISPDAKFVASGSEDETIIIWDISTGEVVGQPLVGHTDAVTSVAFSPDGNFLVSGSHDETILVWDVSSGEVVFGPLRGHTNGIIAVALSADGKKVVSGSRDETVRMWDLDRKEVSPIIPNVEDAHTDGVTCVAFSPCGNMIVSGSDDDTVRVWDANTGKPLLEPIRGHSSWINTVAFAPDGKYVASGSDDGTICIWDVENGELAFKPLEGHRSGVTYISFLPGGERLVSGSYDNSLRIWDVATSKDLFGPLNHHSSWITSIAVSPDGSRAVSSSHDKTVKMWSTETRALLSVNFQEHPGVVSCVAYSPGGRLIASGSVEGMDQSSGSARGIIRVWDTETGELVAGPFEGHSQLVHSLAFSPDEHFIASASGDKTIRVWDVGTRRLRFGPWYGHAGGVVGLAFSHDGKKMVSCSEDETIRVWDTSDLTPSLPTPLPGRNQFRKSQMYSDSSGFTDKCSVQNGWVIGRDDELLFWIPPWNRNGLWWPRNTAVLAGTTMKLDLTKFEYGLNWQRCGDPHA